MIRAFAFLTFSLFVSSVALATVDRCYRIPIGGGPDAIAAYTRSERWCYREHWSPVGSIFAYNADADEAKPELAFIIEPDETLTHGSISAGHFTVRKVAAIGFSPFSVPLRIPLGLSTEENPHANEPAFAASVEKAYSLLSQSVADRNAPVASLAIEPGFFDGSVRPEAMPYRGYYWPTKGFPFSSTMQKFDTFAKSRGVRSKAFEWERDRHAWSGLSWAGHCNGWAASSVLRAEPTSARYDARTNTIFLISDQKGLMVERDYCVSYSFYGRRFPNGSIDDITPGQFHQVVTYNIGTLGRPIAVDLTRTKPIVNNVFSAYRTWIARIDDDEYEVTTEVRDHTYDTTIDERIGRAPSKTLRYRYQLKTDRRGNIVSGTWLTTNPDFIWVPLSGARCDHENPYLTPEMMKAISELPAPIANSN